MARRPSSEILMKRVAMDTDTHFFTSRRGVPCIFKLHPLTGVRIGACFFQKTGIYRVFIGAEQKRYDYSTHEEVTKAIKNFLSSDG